MPWGLQRFQETAHLHYITFSCYRRKPNLLTPCGRDIFERALERVRQRYKLFVAGYVVMPEHVHLLISEPESRCLATAIQSLKQSVSRTLALRALEPFWQHRYYDFNVYSEKKRVEKLKYIHRNPVRRGLVERPEDWQWSSFRHYATGTEGAVEIESEWTARRRERLGVFPQVRMTSPEHPRPSGRGTQNQSSGAKMGHPAARRAEEWLIGMAADSDGNSSESSLRG